MEKSTRSKNKNIIAIFLFLLSSLILIAKVDNSNLKPINFCNNPSQIKTELVVPGVVFNNSSIHQSIFEVNSETGSILGHFNHFSSNKFSLYCYNTCLLHQIKFNESNFTSSDQIVITFQKSNIPHKSSDENPSQLG